MCLYPPSQVMLSPGRLLMTPLWRWSRTWGHWWWSCLEPEIKLRWRRSSLVPKRWGRADEEEEEEVWCSLFSQEQNRATTTTSKWLQPFTLPLFIYTEPSSSGIMIHQVFVEQKMCELHQRLRPRWKNKGHLFSYVTEKYNCAHLNSSFSLWVN